MISKEILRKIRLVVMDLDGTLLDDNGIISGKIISLIKRLNEKGVEFTIATARLYNSVKTYINQLNLKIPIITLDGSFIVNPISEEVLYEEYIPKQYVKRAITLADKYLLNIALCHATAIYYTEQNSSVTSTLEKYGDEFKLVDSYEDFLNKTLEISINSEYSEQIRYVSKKMSFPYTFGISNSYYKSQREGGIYFLEIRKLGSSKGDGLKRLCSHMNIKIKESAVMGDWYNDRTLFETEALKVAVANAVPEIKRLSDIVTRKNNNDGGVAEFLKLLLSAKS